MFFGSGFLASNFATNMGACVSFDSLDELVKVGVNGVVFKTSEELAGHFEVGFEIRRVSSVLVQTVSDILGLY